MTDRAFAAGDPLAALKRVALRGIAMAQLGKLTTRKGSRDALRQRLTVAMDAKEPP